MNIYSLGDTHEGNINQAEKALKDAVEIINEDPHALWIGMGDYIDAITHDDKKRFDPVTVHPKYRISDLKNLPFKQVQNFFEIIKPIQHKCIALLIGNHEEAYAKHKSFDVYKALASLFTESAWGMGKPPVRLGYVGFIVYRLDRVGSIVHALNHGAGVGGKTEGYPITKAWEMASPFECDIFWMGHVHMLVEDDKKVTGVTVRGILQKKRKFVGITASFLETYKEGSTNYYEHKGKKEGDIGMLKLTITLTYSNHFAIKQTKIKLG